MPYTAFNTINCDKSWELPWVAGHTLESAELRQRLSAAVLRVCRLFGASADVRWASAVVATVMLTILTLSFAVYRRRCCVLQVEEKPQDSQPEPPAQSTQPPPLTVLLDIDECLLKATQSAKLSASAMESIRQGNYPYNASYAVGCDLVVMARPGLQQFLHSLSCRQQEGRVVLGLFTAGNRPYANLIAELLDPTGELFGDLVLARENCLMVDKYTYVKDLTVLSQFESRKAKQSSLGHRQILHIGILVDHFAILTRSPVLK